MLQNYVMTMVITLLSLISSFAQAAGMESDFPGRGKYPNVPIYSICHLKQNLSHVVLVDVRSEYEFNILQIKGAINIPIASKNFEDRVKMLRSKTNKPIVFYCNGKTCMKSYLAVKKAQAAKIKNVYAYDGGIRKWAETYPNDSVMMGNGPVRPDEIISRHQFQQHLLSPRAFDNKAYDLGAKSVILDVRDKYQRGTHYLFPGKAYWINLDQQAKLHKFISKAKQDNKTLFIYDQAGRQVQWLQYMLVQENLNNYYFMRDGARAFYVNN